MGLGFCDIIGELVPIDGKFNGEKYLEILREEMLPSVRAIYPKPEIIYVVEDNSPVHRAKIAKKWFEEQNHHINIRKYMEFNCQGVR